MNGVENISKIQEKLGRDNGTVTLTLNEWSELKSYIAKASSLITVGSQSDFWEPKMFENFMWALSDYIYNAEKVIDTINKEVGNK